MTKDEISKVEAYLKKTFKLDNIEVRARPKKDDSAEVYIDDEFVAVLFKDDEDPEDISYQFEMAILDVDLA